MEEYTQPEGEVHLEPARENMPSEQPEVQPVTKQRRKKGKEKQQEGEEDKFGFLHLEEALCWKGVCRRKRVHPTYLTFQGINRAKRLGKILQTSKIWICSNR